MGEHEKMNHIVQNNVKFSMLKNSTEVVISHGSHDLFYGIPGLSSQGSLANANGQV